MDQINVSFTCPKCGPTVLSLPDDATDSDHAVCKKCGADFGPYGKIKERARDVAKDHAVKLIKDAFKGFKKR